MTFNALYAQACLVGYLAAAAIGVSVGKSVLWICSGIWALTFCVTCYFAWRSHK